MFAAAYPHQAASPRQVLFNGHLKTVLEVVQAQMQKVPKVKVAYHVMAEDPDQKRPGNFNLKRSHDVWWVPVSGGVGVAQEEGGDDEGNGSSNGTAGQQNAAKLIPNTVWNSHATKIAFSVKWGVSGLMPIRPQVVHPRSELAPSSVLWVVLEIFRLKQ